MNRRHFLQLSAISASTFFARTGRADEKVWTVGVIGHSRAGDYGHGLDTLWLNLPQFRVVALADADDAGRVKAQLRLPQARAFASSQEMLSEMQPEIVAVAPRWLEEHQEMILAACSAGVKGVYCEKPFCRTPAEADAIVAACEQSGCRVSIAHRNRFHPALPAVRQAIADGAIGTLLEVRGRGKEDGRGGCLDLWVLGSHVIDLARYFTGDAVSCSAVILQGDRPAIPADLVAGGEGVGLIAGDRLHARFEMNQGVPFYFDSIRNAGVREAGFGLQLIGNAGMIDLRVDVEPIAHLVPGNPFRPSAEPRPWIPISSAGVGRPEPIENLHAKVSGHQLAVLDLLDAITQKRPTLCSEQDGRANVEMICGVFASHVDNGARVALPLVNRQHPFAEWGKS